MAPFGEVLTAMITPFTTTGEVDFEQVHRLALYLVANGSDGIVVAGTTGESPTLSSAEKVALFKAVVDAVGSKATVLAGTGTYNTAESIELTKAAASVGAHGVMAVTPYYSKPAQNMLVAHFEAIADASDLPVLLYNIPGRTSRLIEVPTLVRLSEHQRIVAVKDAVDNIVFTSRSRQALPEDFAIYSGSDQMTVPIIAVGGVGVVSVASHLVGKPIKRMVSAARAGDLHEATRLHRALMATFDACFTEPNPVPLKGAMDVLWEPMGPPRLPLLPAGKATVESLVEAVGKAQSL
ncbi:MAG: 4-hydroxy-tetrahydrodipicolinate synthase [Acidimicrobiia bacterium]|nr:4-hydroxy-tetrahydrodipicolinate synthase [Acidimicrobiia bacterium]